ncbi:MAG: alpha-amylase family glycosyl hydrolase, partial [Desulfobacterales bacterium]|nr:alpha-amylase family glycosyl hydrolase [Desulfobacterales bacterium]
MRIPIATYRLQFNEQFDFNSAAGVISYLSDLNMTDIYASPIFKSRKGSQHGYDIIDPNQINPELGSAETFERLADEINLNQMGWVQDIVPNHTAFDPDNALLMDVLENGMA